MKKLLSLALAAVSAVTMLSSCGGKSTKTAMNPEELTGPKAYDEQIEIKIPVYDRGVQGQAPVEDNYWTDYIQKEFGDKYNIKVTYVPITRSDDVNVFNQLLAAGEQPDILFSYDYPVIMNYYSRGAFMPINEDVYKLYAPTFYEHAKELSDYSKVGDEIYFLTATRPLAFNWVTLIRTDWLEKAGLEMPTNREEYVNALRKFKELKLGGEGTIPATQNLWNAYFGNYDYRPYPLSEEENALYSDITVCPLDYEPTKQKLKHVNMLYNEGLISPEFMLDKDGSKAQADFVSGKAGIYGFYLSQNPPVIQTLVENCPEAKVSVLSGTAGYEEGQAPAGREAWPFGMMSGISKDCEHPEAVLMFFEWMVQPENLYVLQNGIEGVTYDVVDDIPVMKTDYSGEEKMNYNSNKDIWCLVTEGKDYGSEEKNLAVQRTTYAPKGYEYLIDESYAIYQQNKDYMYTDFLFDRSLEKLAKYQQTLLSKWEVIQVELITCKPEEFEAKYQAAVEDYLASGYAEVIEEKKEVYAEMTSK